MLRTWRCAHKHAYGAGGGCDKRAFCFRVGGCGNVYGNVRAGAGHGRAMMGRFMLQLAAINLAAGIFTALMPKGSTARSGKRAAGIIALIYTLRALFSLIGGYLP